MNVYAVCLCCGECVCVCHVCAIYENMLCVKYVCYMSVCECMCAIHECVCARWVYIRMFVNMCVRFA